MECAFRKLTACEVGYLVNQKMKERWGIEADKLKLQKLSYICFGYYGGATREHIFDDVIQAWKYGPVIPNLYFNGVQECSWEGLDSMQVNTILGVVSSYGDCESFELVKYTHSKGTPWSKVYKEGVKNIEIPKLDILELYEKIVRGFSFMNNSGLLDDLAKT